MKWAVIGGRDFTDEYHAYRELDKYVMGDDTIVSGAALGADTIASGYANDHHLKLIEYKAEWNKYGKGAGFIRNKLIIDECDEVIAFWDGSSKGTKSSIELARKVNKHVTIIRY